jgi:hypothetical protein
MTHFGVIASGHTAHAHWPHRDLQVDSTGKVIPVWKTAAYGRAQVSRWCRGSSVYQNLFLSPHSNSRPKLPKGEGAFSKIRLRIRCRAAIPARDPSRLPSESANSIERFIA